MNEFMKEAWSEAERGMRSGDGGPFGAVVVKDGRVVGTGHNQVLGARDSTAHAEIVAIRRAESELGTHDLTGCIIYTTCYPCPMCLSAILWARIRIVHFGCTPPQAAAAGFDDQVFYDAVRDPENSPLLEMTSCDQDECALLFHDWEKLADKQVY